MAPERFVQGGDAHRLASMSICELFEAMQLASALVAESGDETARRLRLDQIGLELQSREMQESLEELDVALTSFAAHFYEAPMAYLILDASGRISRINERARQLLGEVDEEEVRHRPLATWLTTKSMEAWSRSLRDVNGRPHGGARSVNISIRAPLRAARATISSDVDGAGRPRGFRVILTPTGGGRGLCVDMLRRMDTTRGRCDGATSHRRALLRTLVPVLACMVWWDQVSPRGNLRRIAAAGGPNVDLGLRRSAQRALAVIPGSQSLQQQVVDSRQPLLLTDCGRAGGQASRQALAAAVRSLIVVPIIEDGRVVAVMTAARRRSARRFTKVDLALAQHVAQRVVDILRSPRRSLRDSGAPLRGPLLASRR